MRARAFTIWPTRLFDNGIVVKYNLSKSITFHNGTEYRRVTTRSDSTVAAAKVRGAAVVSPPMLEVRMAEARTDYQEREQNSRVPVFMD